VKDTRKTKGQLISELQELRRKASKTGDGETAAIRAILDTLPMAVFETDLQLNLAYINRHGFKLLGYSPSDLKKGLNGLDFLAPHEVQRARENHQKRMRGDETGLIEYDARHRDGIIFPILFAMQPIFSGKTIVGFRGMAIDISERKKIEKKLRESEERLRVAGQVAYDLIYQWDVASDRLTWFGNIDSMLGFEEGRISNDIQSWMNLIHPDDRITLKDAVETHRTSSRPIRYQYRIRHKDGSYRYWIDHALPLLGKGGRPHTWIGVCTDITLRKQAEIALRESEHKFRSITENAPDYIFIKNEARRYTFVNSAMRKLLGRDGGKVLGKTPREIFGENQGKIIDKLDERTFAGETVNETRSLKIAGEKRYFNSIQTPLTEENGKVISIMGIVRDVTAYKTAEKKLRNSEERSQAILNAIPDLMFQISRTGIFQDYKGNPADLYTSPDRFMGKSVSEILPDNVARLTMKHLAAVFKTGGMQVFEYHMKIQGHTRYYETRLVKTGKNAVLAIIRNITERKQAEKEKILLERQLRRSQKMETIGTLAGGIAHDFNNLLTPILGYTHMALMDLDRNHPMAANLRQVSQCADRARDLVKQILLFSKRAERALQPLRLQPVVEEALKLLRPSIPASIEIRQRIESGCGKVVADPTQIHQLILNLGTNAWQAMEDSGGTLTLELNQVRIDTGQARLHPNLNPGDYARLTVADTGCGISNENLEHIFEPFFTTKDVDRGTGLGLAVVHGIVQSHKGEITVSSRLKKGTTFQVYLPVLEKTDPPDTPGDQEIPRGTEGVVIVDDEKAIGEMLQTMLQRQGYRTAVFTDGWKALDTLEKESRRFRLAICDLTMPRMSGLDFASQLHRLIPDFPIIIITGYHDHLTPDTCKRYGIKKVLAKPVGVKELSTAVREALD
jgi:PAS domain S-box-containing protein